MKKILTGLLTLLTTVTALAANAPVIYGPGNAAQFLVPGLMPPDTNTLPSPPVGYHKMYIKADDNLYIRNSAGVEAMVGTAGGAGTVTSVGLALPASVFSIAGSPVINTGTLTGSFVNQNANLVWSGPAAGGPASPTFRSLVALDIPSLDFSKITTGVVPIAQGGTGQATQTLGFNALSPLTTKGDLVVHDGTDNIRLGVGADTFVLTADSAQASGVKWAAATGGGGSVTSVDLAVPAEFSLAGNPITTSGTITISKVNQNQNLIYSGPAAGAAASPTFRALVPLDIPALDFSKITTGVVPIAQGGTGQATQTLGFNALSPLTTKGDLLVHNGTDSIRFAACPDGQVVQFDSAQASGIKCVVPFTGTSGSLNNFAYYDAVGNLVPLPTWNVNILDNNYGVASQQNILIPVDAGNVTNKLQSYEYEFAPVQTTSQYSIQALNLDNHFDRGNLGFDFNNGITGISTNLSHEGSGHVNTMNEWNASIGFGQGLAGTLDTGGFISGSAGIGATFTVGNYTGYAHNIQIDPLGVLTNDLRQLSLSGTGAVGTNYFGELITHNGDIGNNLSGISHAFTGNVGGTFYGIFSQQSGASVNWTGASFNQTGAGSTGSVEGWRSSFANGNTTGKTGATYLMGDGTSSGGGRIIEANFAAGNYDNRTAFQLNGGSGNTTNSEQGINISQSSGTSGNYTAYNATGSGTTGQWRGVEVNPTGGVATTAVGFSSDLSSISTPGQQKVGFSSNDGSLNASATYDTANLSASPGFASLHGLGGNLHVAAGFPVTNSAILGSNLAVTASFDDDMGPDTFGGLIGYTDVGYIGSIQVAAGKTVDHVNMSAAGGSIPSGSGTITTANMYEAAGFLPTGGTLTVGELRGFHAPTSLCSSSPTLCYSLKSDSTAAMLLNVGSIQSNTSLILEDPGVGTNKWTIQSPTLAGDFTLTLPVNDGAAGEVLSTDGSGVLSWIPAGGAFLPLAGGTMSGAIDMGNNLINNLTDPASGQDAATKNYVDTVANGLLWKAASNYATAATLPANVYNNGVAGVGATLTEIANGALSVDGNAVVNGERLLIKDEVTPANNGIYDVTDAGSAGTPYILTRSPDYDQAAEIFAGSSTYILFGTANATTSWVMNNATFATVGTDAISFSQIAGPGSIAAGTGLSLAGMTISLQVPVSIANGGTNGITAQASFDNLSPTTTKGDLIANDGTNNVRLAVGADGEVLTADSSAAEGVSWQAAGGTGTVTSVALTVPGFLSVAGSPVTTTGTLAVSLATQAANIVFAGPAAGGAVAPTFRALVAADIPAIDLTTGVTGTLPVANGGTGQVTVLAAFDALSPLTTKADLLTFDGSNNIRQAVGTDGQVLIADSTQGSGLRWGSNSAVVAATTGFEPEVFVMNGGLSLIQDFDGIRRAENNKTIAKIVVCARETGSAGNSTIQINYGPALASNVTLNLPGAGGPGCASSTPAIAISTSDLMNVDLISVASGAPEDLSVKLLF